ncbi:hypothetical protein EDC01DRAFT_784490 [Geopyxis carbonaria]|nr:hypothetical protein EDC01DRAFT_784490 [Geopyxis carbonaria]
MHIPNCCRIWCCLPRRAAPPSPPTPAPAPPFKITITPPTPLSPPSSHPPSSHPSHPHPSSHPRHPPHPPIPPPHLPPPPFTSHPASASLSPSTPISFPALLQLLTHVAQRTETLQRQLGAAPTHMGGLRAEVAQLGERVRAVEERVAAYCADRELGGGEREMAEGVVKMAGVVGARVAELGRGVEEVVARRERRARQK